MTLVLLSSSLLPNFAAAIVGGTAVSAYSPLAKTVVKITFSDESSSSQTCSGTLISSKYVVTAAHCLYEVKNVKVLFPFSNEGSFLSKAKRKALRVFTYPQYSQNRYNTLQRDYDVGVIELETDAPEDYSVVTLHFNENIPQKSKVVISGFGGDSRKTTRHGEDTRNESLNAGVLRQAESEVLEIKSTSNSSMSAELPSHWLYLLDPQEKSTICGGDSGGPIFSDSNSLIQIGIAEGATCNGRDSSLNLTFVNFKKWLQNFTTK